MSTAKDAVMSTPELVELTLAQLPMRDLLVTAPLVCKMWQAITLSPTLQRTLFFQADSKSERVQNPLLVEMFGPFFAPGGLNPGSRGPGNAKSIMAMPWSKAPAAFKRADASWRRMLVMQPPAQTMVVTESSHGWGGVSQRRAVLNDLSLRMGTLYDIAVPLIDRVVSSFCIHWHSDTETEGDLTLAVGYVVQCSMGIRRMLDNRSYTDGSRPFVQIEFGEWCHPDSEDEEDGDEDEY
ncbi:hypothetical protein FB451DRAFT_1293260 [Mycena latifolia]|nr:hypothetical protein FB451DRAFT_1293260 [Mycena latifolia]